MVGQSAHYGDRVLLSYWLRFWLLLDDWEVLLTLNNLFVDDLPMKVYATA